jgi:hypothetical protein
MGSTPNASNKDNPNDPSLQDSLDQVIQLKNAAEKVVGASTDQQDRLLLLRAEADEIGISLSKAEAAHYLAQALGRNTGVPEPKQGGQNLDVSPVPWLWEGVIMRGRQNLVVAPPKVGKSALMVAVAAAALRGEPDFLGIPVHGQVNKVIIVGTDQNVSDWWVLFEREGLGVETVDQNGVRQHELADGVILWSLEDAVQLNDNGLEAVAAMASKHPGSLVLVDTYHACVGQLGIEEASSDFDIPARKLEVVLSGTGSTTVLIHHTNKSVSGGNAITASRGSNSLAGAVSWSVLLNWLKVPVEGQMQTDHRIAVKPMGRSKATNLVVELTDDGWVSHGDGDDAIAAEARAQVEETLQGRQETAYDHCCQLWENKVHTTAAEIATHCNLNRQKALRTLKALCNKGLIVQDGELPPDAVGRPAALYRPVFDTPADPSKKTGGQKGQMCQIQKSTSPERGPGGQRGQILQQQVSDASRAHIKRDLTHLTHLTPADGGGVSEGVLLPVAPGTHVERLIGDAWKNGWLVRDGSNPNRMVIVKLGNEMLTMSNQRWGIDIRESCADEFDF